MTDQPKAEALRKIMMDKSLPLGTRFQAAQQLAELLRPAEKTQKAAQ